MSLVKKRFLFALLAVAVLPLLAGCNRHNKNEHYYLIATNINLAYWKSANAGFQRAATQYGVSGRDARYEHI